MPKLLRCLTKRPLNHWFFPGNVIFNVGWCYQIPTIFVYVLLVIICSQAFTHLVSYFITCSIPVLLCNCTQSFERGNLELFWLDEKLDSTLEVVLLLERSSCLKYLELKPSILVFLFHDASFNSVRTRFVIPLLIPYEFKNNFLNRYNSSGSIWHTWREYRIC